jgi:hypothetical protein
MLPGDWDNLVETWSTGHEFSEHLDFEILHAVHRRHHAGDAPPLEPGQPVPGCSCSECTGVSKPAPARKHHLDRLPVEAARDVPILALVERLGLGPERRVGKEHVIRCFMHDDERPSLSINPRTGLWYCPVCAIGGDGIEMWRRVRGVSFADAVKEIAA